MMKENLTDILNAVYELEGLVQLALNGRQDASTLRQLMIDKTAMIGGMCEALPAGETAANTLSPTFYDETPAPAVTHAPVSAVKPAPAPAKVVVTPVVPAPAPAVKPAPSAAPRKPLYCRPADETHPGASVIPEPQPQPRRMTTVEKPKLRRLFPINEVFLFRRELFGGSDDDFNASLSIVEELPSIESAEAYFYSDLQWDKDNPVVIDFMRIIRKYYRQ